ncbi:MAG: shikimate dehydrogenase [Actinomycetota bacterium]
MSNSASASIKRRPEGPYVAGIVGSPQQVARSLSPAIHNAAFEALGMDWTYLTFGVASDPARAIRGLAAGGVRGMNVTMPHKIAAMKAVDDLSAAASRIGAVNTIEVAAGKLIGHNTDGEGLLRFLEEEAGVAVGGCPVVVIGSGGVARAVVSAMAGAGAGSISVLARSVGRGMELAALAESCPFTVHQLDDPGVKIAPGAVIVNATPVGQESDLSPIPADSIDSDCVVVDLVYEPAVTPLVEQARSRGAIAHSGLGMLINQAALSFEIWTGVQPPMDEMSAAALGQLSRPPG